MEFDGTCQMGHPRKTWWDCVKGDKQSFGLSCENAQDRDHKKLNIKGKPGLAGKWPLKWRVCDCSQNIIINSILLSIVTIY